VPYRRGQEWGLSLEHYDAAKRNPTLAPMMLRKLNNGAMGAAGIEFPFSELDPETRAGLRRCF
jgi:hypothetical protein